MGRWTLGVTAPASKRLTVDFPTAEQPLTIKTGAGTFRRLGEVTRLQRPTA